MTRWDHMCLWNVGPMAKLQRPMFAVHFCKFLLNHKVHGNIRQPDALVHFLLPVQIDQMTRNTFTSILVLTLISQNMDFPFATVTSRSVWKWLSTYLAIPLTCCRLLTLKIVHYNDELAPIFFKENRAGTLLTIPPLAVTLVLYRVRWYRRQPAC